MAERTLEISMQQADLLVELQEAVDRTREMRERKLVFTAIVAGFGVSEASLVSIEPGEGGKAKLKIRVPTLRRPHRRKA